MNSNTRTVWSKQHLRQSSGPPAVTTYGLKVEENEGWTPKFILFLRYFIYFCYFFYFYAYFYLFFFFFFYVSFCFCNFYSSVVLFSSAISSSSSFVLIFSSPLAFFFFCYVEGGILDRRWFPVWVNEKNFVRNKGASRTKLGWAWIYRSPLAWKTRVKSRAWPAFLTLYIVGGSSFLMVRDRFPRIRLHAILCLFLPPLWNVDSYIPTSISFFN